MPSSLSTAARNRSVDGRCQGRQPGRAEAPTQRSQLGPAAPGRRRGQSGAGRGCLPGMRFPERESAAYRHAAAALRIAAKVRARRPDRPLRLRGGGRGQQRQGQVGKEGGIRPSRARSPTVATSRSSGSSRMRRASQGSAPAVVPPGAGSALPVGLVPGHDVPGDEIVARQPSLEVHAEEVRGRIVVVAGGDEP